MVGLSSYGLLRLEHFLGSWKKRSDVPYQTVYETFLSVEFFEDRWKHLSGKRSKLNLFPGLPKNLRNCPAVDVRRYAIFNAATFGIRMITDYIKITIPYIRSTHGVHQ